MTRARSRGRYRDRVTHFLVLVSPSANRVYAADAPRLAAAEATELLGRPAHEVQLAGVPYVECEATEDDVPTLSNLSSTLAIFQWEGDLLRPIPLQRNEIYPDDLVTIQKYQGKTNETWTRLCLNVTAAHATTRTAKRTVMDPMCGRGTTLNLAMLLGYNAIGVDVDKRDFEAYDVFIKTWLRSHRLKHTIATTHRGTRLDLETACDKDAFKAGDTQKVTYLRTDTTALDGVVPKASADLIVTDTPYGVLHGSHAGRELSRAPLELLDAALPAWLRTLKAGGAIGLSYNRHVAPTDDLEQLLERHGLQVVVRDTFRHRVDASIDRDLMVGVPVGRN
ncbi:putative RNA methylase family UPF0020 [Branchiibius hedensis]|uniref:Methyltransferase domain-containing protein n=1 Tax=Branchiibius hedensis TaxID=672460 RepID=A0A2Y8ZXH2_9MICO|nr:putative RNA methylase family UPF0020 [Branchiibius hedensis]SSA34577.1 Methyltransferase domain-containing protein [Branchiibius hedensis]